MDTLVNLLAGLAAALQPYNFLILTVGVLIGVLAGALPGISFVNAMAMSLPFTYSMPPMMSMVFLGGMYVGGVFGGSISSILVNIPGDPDSLPSCWDGYPITKKGGSVHALSIAITASAIGGLFSAMLLAFAAPPFARMALSLDQPEFFAATFLGLVSVLALGKFNLVLSLMSMFVGLAIGAVGADPLYGVQRLTFGLPILGSGIDFVVVMIGLFAIGEVLDALSARKASSFETKSDARMRLLSLRGIWKLRASIARGTGIGSLIGIIPGAGATVGSLVAYGIEKQVNKRGHLFGTGIDDGLAAPEASKNATTGSALIPMLTLGIPGSAGAAIMLAALMLHGVQPGPQLFTNNPQLIYGIFASFILANIMMIVISALVARSFGRLMKADVTVIYAFIIVLSIIGAFGVRNNITDVYLCIAFGILGYFMKRFGFPTAPLILGVILGPLAEGYFMTSLANYNNDFSIFFTRPVSGVLMGFSLFFLVWAVFPNMWRRLTSK
jgi:putative tricarboxylic transport membrane protein